MYSIAQEVKILKYLDLGWLLQRWQLRWLWKQEWSSLPCCQMEWKSLTMQLSSLHDKSYEFYSLINLYIYFRRYRQNIKSFITFITGPLGTDLVSNMMSDATGSSASSRASPYALTTRGGTASKSAPRRPRGSRRYTYMIKNKICLSAILGKLIVCSMEKCFTY